MTREEQKLNTKLAISNSLKKLMKTKPFSKITVGDIVKDCNLNRNTFYYHFTDTYDLLCWMFEEEAINVIKNYDMIVDYRDAILFVVNYISQNEHILNCALDSIGREELKRFLVKDFDEITYTMISSAEKELNSHLGEKYKKFITSFYTEAIAGMIIEWLKNKNDRDTSYLVDYISKTIKNSLLGILKAE